MSKGLTRLKTLLVIAGVAGLSATAFVLPPAAAEDTDTTAARAQASKGDASRSVTPKAGAGEQEAQSRAGPAGDVTAVAARTASVSGAQGRQAAPSGTARSASKDLRATPTETSLRQAPTEKTPTAAKQSRVATVQAQQAPADGARSASRDLRAATTEASSARQAPSDAAPPKAQ